MKTNLLSSWLVSTHYAEGLCGICCKNLTLSCVTFIIRSNWSFGNLYMIVTFYMLIHISCTLWAYGIGVIEHERLAWYQNNIRLKVGYNMHICMNLHIICGCRKRHWFGHMDVRPGYNFIFISQGFNNCAKYDGIFKISSSLSYT